MIVHVPKHYDGSSKVPLVLNMHGSASNAAQQELISGMDATSDAKGFIVAYPQALISESAAPQGAQYAGSGFDWNVPGVTLLGGRPVPKNSADDVAFLTQLVGYLEQSYCISHTQVFATGLSGGARITDELACDSSTTFAAVAPVSGLRRPTPCPTARPVPVISFHGAKDPIDPYQGNGMSHWTYSVPQAAAYWAQQNRCDQHATSSSGNGFTLTRYPGCAKESDVELYTLTEEGHEWPGGPQLPATVVSHLGAQSNAVDANDTMWSFFEAHPMR
ncbi:alpha/beta hydrolase family esterase [Streptomyces sp. NPDC054765]